VAVANFAHVLRQAEGRLQVPEPHRSRILLEIAQDLEELYAAFVARGIPAAEAAKRAEAVFGASSGVLAELDEVHLPMAARLLARFSSGERHRVERGLLTAVTLCTVAAGAGGILAAGVAIPTSPLLWLLPAVLAAAAWCAATAFLDLYGRASHPLTRERLQPMLGLAALSATLGVLGTVLEGWQLATTAGRAASVLVPALPYFRRAAEVLSLCLCQSLTIVLVWFHLRVRALEVERARAGARRLIHPQGGDHG
jgi:hypothetical protein